MLFLDPVLSEERFDPECKSTLLFLGNMSKRDTNGNLKIKAANDLMRRVLDVMDQILGFDVSQKFPVIPSSKIVRFGRTNG